MWGKGNMWDLRRWLGPRLIPKWVLVDIGLNAKWTKPWWKLFPGLDAHVSLLPLRIPLTASATCSNSPFHRRGTSPQNSSNPLHTFQKQHPTLLLLSYSNCCYIIHCEMGWWSNVLPSFPFLIPSCHSSQSWTDFQNEQKLKAKKCHQPIFTDLFYWSFGTVSKSLRYDWKHDFPILLN